MDKRPGLVDMDTELPRKTAPEPGPPPATECEEGGDRSGDPPDPDPDPTTVLGDPVPPGLSN